MAHVRRSSLSPGGRGTPFRGEGIDRGRIHVESDDVNSRKDEDSSHSGAHSPKSDESHAHVGEKKGVAGREGSTSE